MHRLTEIQRYLQEGNIRRADAQEWTLYSQIALSSLAYGLSCIDLLLFPAQQNRPAVVEQLRPAPAAAAQPANADQAHEPPRSLTLDVLPMELWNMNMFQPYYTSDNENSIEDILGGLERFTQRLRRENLHEIDIIIPIVGPSGILYQIVYVIVYNPKFISSRIFMDRR